MPRPPSRWPWPTARSIAGRRTSPRRPRSWAGPTSRPSWAVPPCRSRSGRASSSSCWVRGSHRRPCGSSRLLVERGKVDGLSSVSENYNRLLNAHRGVVEATVTSAVPLTADETAAIRSRVEAMAGSAVELRTEVNPDLIGGLTIQVRDRLLDASIRGRLERLRRHRAPTRAPAPPLSARTETPWPSGQTRSSASSRARSKASTARPRPARSAPWSRSATASRRSTASTPRWRRSCSSSPTG